MNNSNLFSDVNPIVTALAQADTQGLSEAESDAKNLSYADLISKYGADGANALATQYLNGVAQTMDTYQGVRSLGDVVQDSAVNFGMGLGNSLGGTALAAYGISPLRSYVDGALGIDSLNKGARALNDANEYVQDNWLSNKSKKSALRNAYQSQVDDRDSIAKYQQDLAEGKSETVAGLSRIGRDAINAISRATSDSTYLGNQVSNVLGSVAGSIVGAKGIDKAVSAGLSKSLGKETAQKIANKTAWGASIGLGEGGGGYMQAIEAVDSIPDSELLKNPEIQQRVTALIASGMSPKEAINEVKEDIASTIASNAGLTAGTIGLAMSPFTKWMEKPFNATNTKLLGAIASEATEEGAVEGGSQYATNLGIKKNIKPSQDLLEGVGSAIGESALLGGISGGGMKAPSSASSLLAKAAKAKTDTQATKVTAPVSPTSSEEFIALTESNKEPESTPAVSSTPETTPAKGLPESPKAPPKDVAFQNFKDIDDEESSNFYNANLVDKTSRAKTASNLYDAIKNTDKADGATLYSLFADINRIRQSSNNVLYNHIDEVDQASDDDPTIIELQETENIFDRLFKDTDVNDKYKAVASYVTSQIQNNQASKIDPGVLQAIVLNSKAKSSLTENQQKALSFALDMAKTRQRDINSGDINSNAVKTVASQIASKGAKQKSPAHYSIAEHINRVAKAIESGKQNAIDQSAKDLYNFYQTLANKFKGATRSFKKVLDNPGVKQNPEEYTAWNPVLQQSFTNKVYANPYSKKSMEFVQTLHDDIEQAGKAINALTNMTSAVKSVQVPVIPQEIQKSLNTHKIKTSIGSAPAVDSQKEEKQKRIRSRLQNIHLKRTRQAKKPSVEAPTAPVEAPNVSASDSLFTEDELPAVEPKQKQSLKVAKSVSKQKGQIEPKQETLDFEGTSQKEPTQQSNTNKDIKEDTKTKSLPEEPTGTKEELSEDKDTNTDSIDYPPWVDSEEFISPSEEDIVASNPDMSAEGIDEPDLNEIPSASKTPEQTQSDNSTQEPDEELEDEADDQPKKRVSKQDLKREKKTVELSTINNFLSSITAPFKPVFDFFKIKDNSLIGISVTDTPVEDMLKNIKLNVDEATYQQFASYLNKNDPESFISKFQKEMNALVPNEKKNKQGQVHNPIKGTLERFASGKLSLTSFFKNSVEKAYPFLVEQDGKFVFQPQILDVVSIMALQYLMANPASASVLDASQLKDLYLISSAPVTPEFTNWAKNSIPPYMIASQLSKNIRTALGISVKPDAPLAQSESVINALSSNAVNALLKMQALNAHVARYDSNDPAKTRAAFNQTSGNTKSFEEAYALETDSKKHSSSMKPLPLNVSNALYDSLPDEMKANTSLIPALISDELELPTYLGEDIPPVKNKILRSQTPVNTKQQESLENRNKASYFIDPMVHSLYQALGLNGLLAMQIPYSKEQLERANIHYQESIKGQTTLITNAFQSVNDDYLQRKTYAEAHNMSVWDVPSHYNTAMTKVNRFQETQAYGPVADKMKREYSVNVQSEVDVKGYVPGEPSDNPDHHFMDLCFAQAFDIKVEKLSPEDINTSLKDIMKKAKPVAEFLGTWLEAHPEGDASFSAKEFATFQSLMKQSEILFSYRSYKFLGEYAKILNAQKSGNTKIKCALYLEADGITNGIANSQMLFNTDGITRDYILTMSRVGVGYGANKPAYHWAQVTGVDSYGNAGQEAKKAINEGASSFIKESGVGQKTQLLGFNSIITIMNYAQDPSKVDDPENASLLEANFSRSFTKYPFMKKNYGAMMKAIAEGMLEDFEKAFYKNLSEAVMSIDQNTFDNSSYRDRFTLIANAMFPDAEHPGKELTKLLKAFAMASSGRIRAQRSAIKSWIQKGKEEPFPKSVYDASDAVIQDANDVVRFLAMTLAKNPQTFDINNRLSYKLKQQYAKGHVDPVPFQDILVYVYGNNASEGFNNALTSGLTNSMDSIKEVTNLISIIYSTLVKKDLDKRAKFGAITQKDIDNAHKTNKAFAPTLSTKFANLSYEKSDKHTIPNTEAQAFSGVSIKGEKYNVTVNVDSYVTTNSGVAGQPNLTIGAGDGHMMELLSHLSDVLAVFDGVHMPVTKIGSYNQLINETVAKTWDENIFKDLSKSIEKAIDALDDVDAKDLEFSADELESNDMALALMSLMTSLTNSSPNQIAKEDFAFMLDSLKSDIDFKAAQVEARHYTEKQLGISVDQMGGSANPAFVGGEALSTVDEVTGKTYKELFEDPSLTGDAYVDLVQRLATPIYNQKLAELLKETPAQQKIEKSYVWAGQVASAVTNRLINNLPDTPIMSSNEFLNALPPALAERFKELLGDKTLTYHFGTIEELNEMALKNGDTPAGDSLSNGWYSVSSGNIYLVNKGKSRDAVATTMIHETIHAITTEGIQLGIESRLIKGKLDTKARTAVAVLNRLDSLIDTFINDVLNDSKFLAFTQVDMDLGYRREHYYYNIIDAMGIQWNGSNWYRPDSSKTSLEFYGEFLSYTLSDPRYKKPLMYVKVPLGFFTRLKQAVLKVLQPILGKIPFGLYKNISWVATAFGSLNSYSSPTSPKGTKTLHSRQSSYSLSNELYKKFLTEKNKNLSKDAKEINDTVFKTASNLAEIALLEAKKAGFNLSDEEAQKFFDLHLMLSLSPLKGALAYKANKALDSVLKNVTFEDFIKGDPTDPNNKQLAVEKLDYFTGLTSSQENDVPRILAMILSSKEVQNAIKDIDIEPDAKSDATAKIDRVLDDLGTELMNKASELYVKTPNTSKASRLTEEIQRNHFKRITTNRLVSAMEDAYTQIGDKANNYLLSAKGVVGDTLWNKLNSKEKQVSDSYASRAINFFTNVFKVLSKPQGFAKVITEMLNTMDASETVSRFAKDLFGTDEAGGRLEALIKQSKAFIQQLRMQMRTTVPQYMKKKFKNVSEEDWKVMYKAFASSGISFISTINSKKLKVFQDFSYLQQLKKEAINTIKSSHPQQSTVLKKADELVEYLTTGKVAPNLLKNGEAIAQLVGITKSPVLTSERVVDAINAYISLSLIENMSKEEVNTINRINSENPEAMNELLSSLNALHQYEEEKKHEYPNSLYNGLFGYFPSESSSVGSIKLDKADLETQLHYESLGYTLGKTVDTLGQTFGYYHLPVNPIAMFNSGGFQNIITTVNGVNAYSGISTDPMVITITDKNPDFAKIDPNKDSVIPVFNAKGKITAYEYRSTPEDIASLDRSTNLADMIGVAMGRKVEELNSNQINEPIIDELIYQYKHATPHERKTQFINVYDSKDPIIKDAVSILSPSAKEYLHSELGQDNYLPIRKDMIPDVLGSREASIGDLWTGKTRWSADVTKNLRKFLDIVLGGKAYVKLLKAEQLVQRTMAEARSVIVVKSLVVSYFNAVSNYFSLMGNGLAPTKIARETPNKLYEIESYVKTTHEIIKLKIKADSYSQNDPRRAVINKRIKNHESYINSLSIYPLIQSGEFSTVSDIGTTNEELDLTTGNITGAIEAKINELPEGVRDLIRYSFITSDTSFYKFAMKATVYGDFVAKSILYDYLVQHRDMSMREALDYVRDEFVNYDLNPGRTRGYLEKMGLGWFLNYKLRVTKSAYRMMRNNPFYGLLVLGVPFLLPFVSTPFTDNIVAQTLNGSVWNAFGPNMLTQAVDLHPMMQLGDAIIG